MQNSKGNKLGLKTTTACHRNRISKVDTGNLERWERRGVSQAGASGEPEKVKGRCLLVANNESLKGDDSTLN